MHRKRTCWSVKLIVLIHFLLTLLLVVYPSARAWSAPHQAPPLPQCPPPPHTPGVPLPNFPCHQSSSAPSRVAPAQMCIRLTANEEQAPAPQPLQLYQITMSNTGHGQANNVRVTLPYSPEIHSLLDASFSDEQTWVYSVLTNAVEIRTNSLASGDVVTATLRFQINQLPAVSGIFSTRAFASWSNERPGASKVSNLVSIELGRSTRPALSLKISAVSEGKTEYLSIASNNFASYERVSLWYHRPDKNALALGETQSDEHGNILYNAEIDTQEPGQYMVVAYGQCSRVYINGILEVG